MYRNIYIVHVHEYSMENNKITCPHCKSKEVIKRGYFKTQAQEKQQRYFCKSCSKKFIPQNAFYRMRNRQEKITLCLDLFFRGISTRKIQEHLQAFYPYNSSHKTIYKWVVKYSNLIHNKVKNIKLNVGSEIQVDEMEVGKRTSKFNGWFIDSIDTTTRFMVSSDYVKSRGQKEIRKVLGFAKKKTEKQLKIITTDGYTAYEDVIKKTFGYNNKLGKYNVFHHKVTQLKNEGFNHKIERLHNSVRHRIKTFRGFHGSLSSANAIMKGFEVYYNFIRKHQAIGKCPYELATNIKLNNPNKWLELIELKE
jgi:putative transposase